MPKKITYKSSGVDIGKADLALRKIKSLAQSTFTPGVLSELGKFGGFFALKKKYKEPVLISSTDSVGTKLKVAFMLNLHDTVGEDLVNHCVNDILVHGAKPLFFLDYIGTSRLEPEVVKNIVSGLSRGCRRVGCALVGGEMAELPEFYKKGEYDLVGFIVGVVEREKIIDGSSISPGDQILGLRSNGLHTNGYSLARRVIFDAGKFKAGDYVNDLRTTIGRELLKVHRCYAPSIFNILKRHKIKGMAHITGGGISGNLYRILPEGCKAIIDTKNWKKPPIISFIQKTGDIDPEEMYKVFNMGIGLVLLVSGKEKELVEKKLKKRKERVYHIGEIVSGKRGVKLLNIG
ncbi:MAG: phosphoribosylaminoimidazole synthetase [candidate division Zixibacteria bacterium SM23_73_2]|nr:MAG: phosphoribosylaminoimidazole synthetase [candidate division Zixibacteria bacterium SM23_73_2]